MEPCNIGEVTPKKYIEIMPGTLFFTRDAWMLFISKDTHGVGVTSCWVMRANRSGASMTEIEFEYNYFTFPWGGWLDAFEP